MDEGAVDKVDVLVSGAGPVGLLITLQLRRLGISTLIVDAADKASPNFRESFIPAVTRKADYGSGVPNSSAMEKSS